ncbi:MAG TPA: hypothetical protein VNA87_05955 [Actinomycetota bacterium]|nr:hypothetical protein [Actinomycetota bacterium]
MGASCTPRLAAPYWFESIGDLPTPGGWLILRTVPMGHKQPAYEYLQPTKVVLVERSYLTYESTVDRHRSPIASLT